MNAPQSASLYSSFARSLLRRSELRTASAAGLLRVQSQHLPASCWTRATSCSLTVYEINSFYSAHCLLSLANLCFDRSRRKGHQTSSVIHQSSGHIWAKFGRKWMNKECVHCSIQELCTVNRTRQWLLPPGAASLTGATVFSGIIIVWCVITECGHSHWVTQAFPLRAGLLIWVLRILRRWGLNTCADPACFALTWCGQEFLKLNFSLFICTQYVSGPSFCLFCN